MSEVKFPEGIRAYKPNENAPDFIKANIQINTNELLGWLQGQEGSVRLALKEAKSGNFYLQVDEYAPQQPAQQKAKEKAQPKSLHEDDPDNPLPF